MVEKSPAAAFSAIVSDAIETPTFPPAKGIFLLNIMQTYGSLLSDRRWWRQRMDACTLLRGTSTMIVLSLDLRVRN